MTRGKEKYICDGCDAQCLMELPENLVPEGCNVKGKWHDVICKWVKIEKKYMQLIDDNMG